jgi:succinate dehydrogenase hydrophobic anchor subunit
MSSVRKRSGEDRVLFMRITALFLMFVMVIPAGMVYAQENDGSARLQDNASSEVLPEQRAGEPSSGILSSAE